MNFFSVGVTVALLVRIQGNLNRYWESVSNSTQAARFGVGEVVFSVLGVLTWLDALVSVASESYRLGV